MDVFREDVTALLPHLRAFARSLTSGDRQLADDIVQDTIVNALRRSISSRPGPTSRPGCSPFSATGSTA